MDDKNQKSISDAVFDRIKSGGVKMRPKIYFILKSIWAVFVIVFAVLFILYLVSFIVFSLRASGTWFLPRFGFPGIKIFIASFPWIPILIAVISVVLLEIFTKRFNFVYRRPILYSLLGIIIIVLAGGFLLERTTFHSNLFLKAQKERSPGIGYFYRDFGAPPMKDAHFGLVSKVTENGFLIQTPRNETTTIMTTEETRLPSEEIKEGDRIMVLGKMINGEVQAFDIRKIEENFNLFPPLPPRDNFPPH